MSRPVLNRVARSARRRDPRRLETDEAHAILAAYSAAAVVTALLALEFGAVGLTVGLAYGLAAGFVCCRWLNARLSVRLRLRDTPWLGDCRVNGCGLWFTASHQVAFGSIVVGARSLAGLLAMVQAVDPSRIGSAEEGGVR